MIPQPDAGRAAFLANAACLCINLDRNELVGLLDRDSAIPGFGTDLATSHPHLFSNSPIFMATGMMATMRSVVQAVEAAASLPSFLQAALARAAPVAHHDFGPVGVLMGYDFHLTDAGPVLIEVNTNAGGAFLNAVLVDAQRQCCFDVDMTSVSTSKEQGKSALPFKERIISMFEGECRRQGHSGKLKTVAIIDDDPEQQFLLPEFVLVRALIEKHGIAAVIADPRKLQRRGERLFLDGLEIDLVYNRLVDFALEEQSHSALRQAYIDGAVVVTPNPHIHALYADKRNLALLSDEKRMQEWGLSDEHVAVLKTAVPHTVLVTPDNADELWADRRGLFFKPARGYGSKAAYRGAKLTRKVWSQIVSGEYIAQAFAPPSFKRVIRDGEPTEMKVDVRLYTYAGEVLMTAARLYQGQTTNMRTPGGGFAPVIEIADLR